MLFSQYSNLSRTGIPLDCIPKLPPIALAVDESHYHMVRHNELAGARRAKGMCVAEGMSFATGEEAVGDAVAPVTACDMHGIDAVIRPRHRLYRVPGFEDHATTLCFVDVCKRREGVIVMHTLVLDAHGELADHLIVFDAWRRLLFLGAGELTKEWLVGLLGVQGGDLLRGRLDERLRNLRVMRLMQVRVLMEKAPSAPSKKKLTGRQREALKRKRAESEGEE